MSIYSLLKKTREKNKKGNAIDHLAHSRLTWRYKHDYYHSHMEKYFQFIIPAQSSVLQIGCLTGNLLSSLNPSRGMGMGMSITMIETARKNFPHLEFRQGSLDDFDIHESFDYIILGNTIGYANDLQKSFLQLKKACRADTTIIISCFNHLWKPVLQLAEVLGLRMKWPGRHWISLKDVKNLLYLTEYQVISEGQKVLIPFYIPLISTFFNRYLVQLPLIRHLAFNHVLTVKPIGLRKSPQEVSCSVIIPCRNEKGNIENAVLRTPDMGIRTEFIFIEGKSSDGTREECERIKEKYKDRDIKVLVQKGAGKGDAVREGFSAASGDVLMILDADLTTPPEGLPRFFDAIVSGKGEFINGSRLVYGMEKNSMQFLNMIANKLFGIILTYLLGQYIKDTLCGTKVLWREDYERIVRQRQYFGDFDPFGDFDLLFGAAKLNLKIIEIPVHYRDRQYGSTQIRRFEHGWLLVKMTFFAMRKIKFV